MPTEIRFRASQNGTNRVCQTREGFVATGSRSKAVIKLASFTKGRFVPVKGGSKVAIRAFRSRGNFIKTVKDPRQELRRADRKEIL